MTRRFVISFIVLVITTSILMLTRTFYRTHPRFELSGLSSLQVQSNAAETQLTGPAVVHFWASWCAPCQEEFSSLVGVASHLNPKLKVILISADEDKNQALSFLQKFQVPVTWYNLWDDKNSTGQRWEVDKFPETLIFDEHLQLLRRIGGPMDWSNPKNLSYLNSL